MTSPSSSSSSSSTLLRPEADAEANLLGHDENRQVHDDRAISFGGHYVDMGGDAEYNGGDSDIEAIERQFEAMENRNRVNNENNDREGWGMVIDSIGGNIFREDRSWNQLQMFYGDSLIPEESVSLSGLMKSDLFYFNCYAFVVVAVSTVALKVDWKRAQDIMKTLQIWTVINIILHIVLFIANYIAMALFTKYSTSLRLLYLLWFAWFVFGAVVVFNVNKKADKYKAPILFSSSYGIIDFDIFFLLLFAFFIFFSCLVRALRGRRNYQRINDGAAEDARALNTETINDLPTVKYSKETMGDIDATCGICLSEYQDGEMLKYLPCHHHFHLECIDTWLVTNKTCPYCKHPADVPLDSETQEEQHTSYHAGPSSSSASSSSSFSQ